MRLFPLLLLAACPQPEKGGDAPRTDDTGETGETGDTGETAETGDTGETFVLTLPGEDAPTRFTAVYVQRLGDGAAPATAFGPDGAVSETAMAGADYVASTAVILLDQPDPCPALTGLWQAYNDAVLAMAKGDREGAAALLEAADREYLPEDYWQIALGAASEDDAAGTFLVPDDGGSAVAIAQVYHHVRYADWTSALVDGQEIASAPAWDATAGTLTLGAADPLPIDATLTLDSGSLALSTTATRCTTMEEALGEMGRW